MIPQRQSAPARVTSLYIDRQHVLRRRIRRPTAIFRQWPWRAALIAAAFVDLLIGAARRFDFHGIEGFSTTNYGWLAFSLVGGIGLAWRLARPPAGPWLLARALIAPAVSFVFCFAAVTVMGLLFLPHQPLTETLTTDAPVAHCGRVCSSPSSAIYARRSGPPSG